MALSALLVSLGSAQSSDYTDPIGVMTYWIDGGTVDSPTTTMIALPLTDAPAASGATQFVISAVDGETLTSSSAGWVDSTLAMSAFPYDLRMLSGEATGARFAIIANTTDTLTVAGRSLAEFTIAAGLDGDLGELVPVDTLELLFGGELFKPGSNADEADEVTLFFGPGPSGTYFLDQETEVWLSADSPFDPSSDIRLPAEGAVAVSRKGASLNLIVAGNVPTTQVNIAVANSGSTFTNSGLPIDVTLGELALHTRVVGWQSDSDPAQADAVGISAGAGWVYYYHNGASWRRVSGAATDRDSVVVAAGKPMRIVRRGGAAGSTELIVPLP